MKLRIIYPSKTKMLVMFFASLIFSASSFWLIQRGTSMSWEPFIFFGFCTMIFAVGLLPRASFLKIEEDGFTLVSYFTVSRFSWDEVANFRVEKQRVAFDFSPISARDSVFAITEANLPEAMGFRPDSLARLLNEYANEKKEVPNQRLQGTPESGPSSSTDPEARRP